MNEIFIREMFESDLPQVLEIEHMSFTTPWNISSFKYELHNKDAILKVAVYNNQLLGYVCIRTILDETYVLNLAVLPEFKRMGIGSRLLENALEELKNSSINTNVVTLEVRASNIAAIRLYEKFGFKIAGKRIGYYQKPQEDAVIMKRDTDSTD